MIQMAAINEATSVGPCTYVGKVGDISQCISYYLYCVIRNQRNISHGQRLKKWNFFFRNWKKLRGSYSETIIITSWLWMAYSIRSTIVEPDVDDRLLCSIRANILTRTRQVFHLCKECLSRRHEEKCCIQSQGEEDFFCEWAQKQGLWEWMKPG